MRRRDLDGRRDQDLEAQRLALTGFCYRMLGSAADTDDAVQETMVRAYRNLAGYDPARGRLTTQAGAGRRHGSGHRRR